MCAKARARKQQRRHQRRRGCANQLVASVPPFLIPHHCHLRSMPHKTTLLTLITDRPAQGMKELTLEQREQQRHQRAPPPEQQIFEGQVVESGEGRSGSSHIITAVAGSGPSKQAYNFSTERVVGNGSFGVVFQATCLETAETVRGAGGGGRGARGDAGVWRRGGSRCCVWMDGSCYVCLLAAALVGGGKVQLCEDRRNAGPGVVSTNKNHTHPRPARRWRSRRCCRTSASRTASSRS
jgi:hypothetical protein